ncbi:MAG: glycosyltransferase [bacterium]|nr:glycosyltransferase [bacterium]
MDNALKRLSDLPQEAKVCLYGAGEAGRYLLRLLQEKRRDIEVVCFLDSFSSGEKDGLKVLKPEQLVKEGIEYDLILITSAFHSDIRREMRIWGIGNYKNVSPRLLEGRKRRMQLWLKRVLKKKWGYWLVIAMLYPVNRLLALTRKNKVHENSVLHISYMVHIAFFTVQILREHGIKADYMAIGPATKVWNKSDYHVLWSKRPIVKAFQEFKWFWGVVARYEVIHSHFSMFLSHEGWELKYLKKMNRKIVVHYRGCTTRDREVNFRLNPEPHHNICYHCDYKARNCSNPAFAKKEELGKKYGDLFLVTTPDLKDFAPHAIHLPFFSPVKALRDHHIQSKPVRANGSFKIVHVTVHPGIEGTARIREVIRRLKDKGYAVEFLFKRNAPYEEVLKDLASADLSIGKMKMGYYANAQIESMALGVPTITYVRPQFMNTRLEQSGLIFSDLKNLEETLQYYLDNPDALAAKKAKARETILELHDNHKIATDLIGYYNRLKENTEN